MAGQLVVGFTAGHLHGGRVGCHGGLCAQPLSLRGPPDHHVGHFDHPDVSRHDVVIAAVPTHRQIASGEYIFGFDGFLCVDSVAILCVANERILRHNPPIAGRIGQD